MERHTGARRRRHKCFEEHQPLYVHARSREAGCLAREEPLYRGRGEAARDCVGTVEPFRRQRQIVYFQYGVRELQPVVLLRPGPTGRFD